MYEIIIGAIIFLAGYLTCFFTVKKQAKSNEVIKQVKRVKPSFKSPLKPYDVSYEKYKENGLYQPSKPKRGDG